MASNDDDWLDIDKLRSDLSIDPDEISLAKLLDLANEMSGGILVLRGELASEELQWGTIVIFGGNAESIMRKLQDVINDELTEFVPTDVNLTRDPEDPGKLSN
jgi:hypothetical protein